MRSPTSIVEGDASPAAREATEDVDAPMEASLVQGAVSRAARRELYAEMRHAIAGGGADAELHDALIEFEARAAAQEVAPGEQRWARPANAIGAHSKLLDMWYLDDGVGV